MALIRHVGVECLVFFFRTRLRLSPVALLISEIFLLAIEKLDFLFQGFGRGKLF